MKRLLGEERASPRKREGGIRYRQSYVDRWIDELAPRSLAAAAAYASIYLSPAQLQPVTHAQSEGAVPTCVMSVYVVLTEDTHVEQIWFQHPTWNRTALKLQEWNIPLFSSSSCSGSYGAKVYKSLKPR